jgi:hypothetical protein
MHFFHVHDGTELSPWRVRCIQSVKDVAQTNGHTYEMLLFKPVSGISPIKVSDDIRIEFLNKRPDAVYIDTDAYLLKCPVFDKQNTPYMAEFTMLNHGEKFPDVYLMASNGASSWFDPDKFRSGQKDGEGYGYRVDFLKSLAGFEYINIDCILHPYSTAPTIKTAPVDNSQFKQEAATLLTYHLQSTAGMIQQMMEKLN